MSYQYHFAGDPAKAAANREKHGVSLELAATLFVRQRVGRDGAFTVVPQMAYIWAVLRTEDDPHEAQRIRKAD